MDKALESTLIQPVQYTSTKTPVASIVEEIDPEKMYMKLEIMLTGKIPVIVRDKTGRESIKRKKIQTKPLLNDKGANSIVFVTRMIVPKSVFFSKLTKNEIKVMVRGVIFSVNTLLWEHWRDYGIDEERLRSNWSLILELVGNFLYGHLKLAEGGNFLDKLSGMIAEDRKIAPVAERESMFGIPSRGGLFR